MRAIFLKRNYVEKSKKSGKSMVVLDVFQLPQVKRDGTGEMTQGNIRTFFVMDPGHFDMGKGCSCGDLIDVSFEFDENYNRGIPVSVEVVQGSPYDPALLVG